MTDSIIDIIRQVVRQEMRSLYTAEIGEVTAVFPHASGGDKDNYQCSVKLKNKKQDDGSDFELRMVPVTTPHIGQVNIPNVGDLVLLAFIGGNINAPVITGRLYNDADQPPVNTAGEFIIQHNLQNGSSLKIDGSGVLTLTSQQGKSVATVDDNKIELTTSGGKVTIDNQKVVVEAPQIQLVANAMHPAVFGDELMTYLNQLMAMFNAHTHPGELALGVLPVTPMPPVPPFPPPLPTLLSMKVTTG